MVPEDIPVVEGAGAVAGGNQLPWGAGPVAGGNQVPEQAGKPLPEVEGRLAGLVEGTPAAQVGWLGRPGAVCVRVYCVCVCVSVCVYCVCVYCMCVSV